MAALLLRLLLILSLLLNGAGAPWAMEHAPPNGAETAAQVATANPPRSEAHSGCAQHGAAEPDPARSVDAADAADSVDAAAGDADPRSCCDGPGCHCGCVLPPAATAPAMFAKLDPPAAAPTTRLPAMGGAGHDRPPYRPPAV